MTIVKENVPDKQTNTQTATLLLYIFEFNIKLWLPFSSIVIVHLTSNGGSIRKVLSSGNGLSCLHLNNEKLLAGGYGWVASWRVLARENYSRKIILI